MTRLSSPRDTVAHDQAAAAVPLAVGWRTLIAHVRDGQVFDGAGPVTGAQLIERLDLAEGGFDGVVMVVGDAATGEAGRPAAAADLHAASENRVPRPGADAQDGLGRWRCVVGDLDGR